MNGVDVGPNLISWRLHILLNDTSLLTSTSHLVTKATVFSNKINRKEYKYNIVILNSTFIQTMF